MSTNRYAAAVISEASEVLKNHRQGRMGLFLAVLEWFANGGNLETFKGLTKNTYKALKLHHTDPDYYVVANNFKLIKRVVTSENRYLQAELNLIADGESDRYTFEALLDWAKTNKKPGKAKKLSKFERLLNQVLKLNKRERSKLATAIRKAA